MRIAYRRLPWLPVNAVQVALIAIWTAGWITLAVLARTITGRKSVPLELARRFWGPGALALVGARLTVENPHRVDLRRAHLVVMNHSSFVDIPAAITGLPGDLHFVAKKELAKVPFLGWYMKVMDMIFVERGAGRSRDRALGAAAGLLEEEASLAAFPEGTRSQDGEVHPFKTGVFVPAIEAGIPVLPVAIVGAERVLPPRSLWLRPGRITLKVAEPIPTEGLGVGDRRALAETARQAIRSLRT